MKKFLVIILFLSIFLLSDAFYIDINNNTNNPLSEMNFIYISYLEYLDNFKGNSASINKSKIDKMLDNITLYNFNTIIIQVSPFSDAIYNSKIFPYSYTLTGVEGKNPGFDYLEYFIKKAHQKKIKVHAWINPYRISSKSDIKTLSKDNPALQFLDTENISISDKGIYYDPTSELVKQLIEKQVLEIMNNYDIDGIHFDDYFYVDYEIDNTEYNKYIENNPNISRESYRLMHTNDLIKRVGKLIKEQNNDIIFSIAPDGNINNNYKYHYADVKTWLNEEYIDVIMPQLYYGFDNQYLPFVKSYNLWNDLIKEESSVRIVPVLAFYKVGSVDNNAGTGKNEWLEKDIIRKQILFLKDDTNYYGFGLFRYDYLFNEKFSNDIIINELKNIRTLCK